MMKLFLNQTSPYARVVRIILLEKNLIDQTELCWCDPWSDDETLIDENPASKIPTLKTHSGTAISETLLIVSYLNDLTPENNLIPSYRKEQVYHLAGLGQALMDASFSTVIARKYSEKKEDDSVLGNRRKKVITRTLKRLENNIDHYFEDDLSLGEIIIAVALDYLVFRLPELNIGLHYPKLDQWRKTILQSKHFENTAFE